MLERILWAAVGAFAFFSLVPSPDPVVYHDIVVPAARIIEREPPARPPTIVERLVFIAPRPVTVATAPQGAALEVADFCRPAVLTAAGDSSALELDPQLLLRSGRYSPGRGKDELLLVGVTSFGDLRSFDFKIRGGFDFRADGDSVLVRYGRWAFVNDAWTTTAKLYTIFEVGRGLAGLFNLK